MVLCLEFRRHRFFEGEGFGHDLTLWNVQWKDWYDTVRPTVLPTFHGAAVRL